MKPCLFVGVDTHKNSHTAAVLDGYFAVVATVGFTNSTEGFCHLDLKLKKLASGRNLVFGLEDSQGLGSFLAQYLIDKGHLAMEVNPVSTDRGRRYTVSRDKSDERDAILIAKTLIKERASLHPVSINKNSVALREMVGYRQMLVRESTRIKNRLHVALFNQYKGILGQFGSLFSKCALAFFARYPNPCLLKEVDCDTLSGFLKANSKGRYGSKKAGAILSNLDNSIAGTLEGTRAHIIESHVERLIQIAEELKKIGDILEELVEKSSYDCLVSIPGIDTVTAAKIISGIMDIARFSSSAKLAKFCGIAPLRKAAEERKSIRNQNMAKSPFTLPSILWLLHISAEPEMAEIKTQSQELTTLKRSLKARPKRKLLPAWPEDL